MVDTVNVDVNQGTLRGKKTNTKYGKPYYTFQGVPYAKPPVGPLRFKVAQPVEPWSGVRDALQEGSNCTQYDLQLLQFKGSEDCLYLNIYSPQLPESGSQDLRLPVMVWIHGGGYVCGTGSSYYYGADYLVDEGVIVVTINYRLGILGFLCLNDPVAPGNIGLKDQVAALRWVQNNISKFGGDPSNVTLFGESAGAASVHMHMLSPMSKGLFCRAIAQSGAAFNPWGLENHPREAAFRVGAALGFDGDQPEELVEFLRGIDHMTLFKAAMDHGFSERDKHRILVFAFVPTLEVEVEGEERFLPAHPLELLEKGHYHDVPYLTGVTDREGLVAWRFSELNKPETVKKVDREFGKVFLPDIRLPEAYGKAEEAVSKLRQYFLGDKPLGEETFPGFIDLCTDVWFAEGIHITVKKMAELDKAPVYYYKFSYDGNFNSYKLTNSLAYPGACHADDLGYLFNPGIIDMDTLADPSSVKTRARMVKMWTNFAKTGNPTPNDDPLLSVKWDPHTTENPCYLEIDEDLVLKKDMFKERMEFWEEFYSNS